MNLDSTFILWAALKLSLLIGGSLLLLLALRKAEPRWRVLVLRAALIAMPVAVVAGSMAPTFRLPISVHGDVGAATSEENAEGLPTVLIPTNEFSLPGKEKAPADSAAGVDETSFRFWQVVLCLWWSGVVVLFIREAVLKRRLAGDLAEAAPSGESLQSEWQSVCDEFGIAKVPPLTIGSSNSSPFLVGGKSPQLLVPRSLVDDGSVSLRRHVFRHEAAHLAAGDLRWLAVMRLLSRLFWMQPLFWLLEAKHLQACEEAADAEAARRGGTAQYRSALASLALDLVPAGRAIPATAFFRGPSVVRRLRAVLRHGELRPPSRWRSLVLIMAIVALGAVLGNSGLAERGVRSTIDLQMAELSYEGYQGCKKNGEREKAVEYLKMAIEYLPNEKALDGRRTKWSRELDDIKFLERVAEGWQNDSGVPEIPGESIDSVERALRKIIIPWVDFRDTPVSEAIDFLHRRAVESYADKELPFQFELDVERPAEETEITLKLANVPLGEALRYTTSLAQLQLKVEFAEEKAVIRIVPLVDSVEDLFTTVYDVTGIREFEEDGANAKQILMNVGISFPEKASAIVNPARGQLIVRNTQSQMELVKAWLEDARQRAVDPSNIWFRAYTLMKEGEALSDEGRLLEALSKYNEAKRLFDEVYHQHSHFHPEIVRYRRKELDERITEIRKQLGEQVKPSSPLLVPSQPVPLPERKGGESESLALGLFPSVPVHPSEASKMKHAELADAVLEFHEAKVADRAAQGGGQIRTLNVQILATDSDAVVASKMSLVVKFYDRAGKSTLEIGAGETETRFPSLPYDWADRTQGETVEIEYHLPKAQVETGDREYFGYVAELYYDGVLQGVMASPSKLLRLVE